MIKLVNLNSFDEALDFVPSFCADKLTQNITIIVPDKLSLFMEKHIFEKLNLKASFNIRVSTLDRLVKRDLALDKSKQISKLGCIVLVHKILMDLGTQLKVLKNKTYSFSYAEEIFSTLAQLKASKITVEEMLKFKHTNTQLQDKIHDLAMIFDQYEQQKAGLLDITDQFLMCCFSLKEKYQNQTLVFVGFDDFTAVEYTAIEQLAYFNQLVVANYFAKSNNQHLYNDEVAAQLKNIAYINQLPFEVENYSSNSADQLKNYLKQNLFGIKASNTVNKDNRVKIFACRDNYEQIEIVARDIRTQILNGGKFSNFGVAVFGVDGLTEQIMQIFGKYEINFYLDENLRLSDSTVYKFLNDIFRLNLEPYELVHYIDIINSPFFTLDEIAKQALILRLIQIDFKGNLTKKIDLNSKTFKDQNKAFAAVDLNVARDELIKFLANFNLANTGITQIKQVLNNAFENLQFEQTLADLQAKEELFSKQILLNKSIETIKNIFDEIEKFYPTASLETVADMFFHLGDITNISNLPLTLDAVKVVDANNFCERFENLYIIGCSAENAPNFKNDCGVIVDSEIEELNFKYKLAPTIAHINKLARLRLFNSSLLFNTNLTLLYSRTQSELIREFLLRLTQNNQNIKPISNLFGGFVALSKQDYVEKNLENKTHIFNQFINTKNLQQVNSSNECFNFNTISASRLETYFKCPFNHFLNYTLKVKPRLKNDIMPLDTGNILHEILFNYYTLNKQVGDLYEFAKTQIFKIIERDERLKLNAKSPVLTNLIDETVRVLNGVDYIDKNCNFKPVKFEYEFKDKTALNLGKAKLKGKIDRVDTDGSFLRIVDYKTGKAEASLKELYYGNKLQLFLYACAMENASKQRVVGEFYLPLHNAYTTDKNTYSLKGFFENTEENVKNLDNRLQPGEKSDIVNLTVAKTGLARKFGDKELQPSEMQTLKDYSKQVSALAIEEIKSGFIKPTPSGVSLLCDSCPYVQICLKKSNAQQERSAQQVGIDSFLGGEQ